MAAQNGAIADPGSVLVATDLSSRSDRAVDRALQLAKDWNATLHVVHVVPDETDLGIPGRDWSAPWREPDQAREVAEHQLRRDFGVYAGLQRIRFHVESGDPGKVVSDLALREDCGLIVTGVARNETLGRMLLGDTVDFLVRKASVPVLVVRNRVHGRYQNLLVATDFSPASAEALQTALALFPESKTTLLHAYEIPFSGSLMVNDAIRAEFREMGEKAVKDFLQAAELPGDFPSRLEIGSPADAITKSLQDEDALVVIGSHGASAIATVLLGSTARRILNKTVADVLVVPFTKRPAEK